MASLSLLAPPVRADFGIDTTDYSEPFAPTFDDEANLLGFSLTLDGEDPAPPRGWPLGRLVAFYDGQFDAWKHQAREERLEMEAWLDRLDEIHNCERHEAEIVEAIGVIESRKGGAL